MSNILDLIDYCHYLLTDPRMYACDNRSHLHQRICSLEYFLEITLRTESIAFRLQQ